MSKEDSEVDLNLGEMEGTNSPRESDEEESEDDENVVASGSENNSEEEEEELEAFEGFDELQEISAVGMSFYGDAGLKKEAKVNRLFLEVC